MASGGKQFQDGVTAPARVAAIRQTGRQDVNLPCEGRLGETRRKRTAAGCNPARHLARGFWPGPDRQALTPELYA
jgi:hypothetical protein